MRKRAGLTRIDLVVAVACVVFVLANVPVIGAAGRGRSKREVCMANLKTLTAAWTMYADDHQGRIPCADIGTGCHITGMPQEGPGWYEWPHRKYPPEAAECDFTTFFTMAQVLAGEATEKDWKHSIADGSLWKYIKNYGVYRCPAGGKNAYVTYTIAHSMNAYEGVFGPAKELRTISEIKRVSKMIAFLCEGQAGAGAFGIMYDNEENGFFDVVPKRHDNGTTFSFADGHTEYWKWQDKRTLAYWFNSYTDKDHTDQSCNQDLYRLQKGTWGKLGYTPSCTPEY
jgi:prepilin-type processing-associated H-X9-DG protein